MAVEHQEDSQILLEQIMPQIAAQLRGAMGNIHTALTRLVPEEMPEGEGSTGQSAAHPVPELLPAAAAGEQSLRRPPDLSNRAAGDEECGAGGVADGADALRPAAGGPCRGEADPAVQP